MTESFFTRKLLKALRSHPALKDAVIWKINDHFSAGIPDFLIAIGKHTEYFEVKIHPNTPTKLQKYYLEHLREAGHLIIAEKNFLWVSIDGCVKGVIDDSEDLLDWLVERIVIRCVNA